MKRFLPLVVIGLVVGSLAAGCQNSETEKPASQAQDGTVRDAQTDTAPPKWILASRSWPDTLRYTLNSDLEVYQDDLMFRMRPEVFQDFRRTDHPNSTPLDCQILVTVRPIPTWPHAKGMVMDSVVFYDTVRKRNLPGLPMLSTSRQFDDQTVRTLFTPNLANPVEPKLTDGQLLEPTIYLSWDGRTIIVKASAIPVKFMVRETM